MNNNDLYFILGSDDSIDKNEEIEIIVKHLDKENISYSILSEPDDIQSYGAYRDLLKGMINEAIKKEKVPVLVQVNHSLDLPSVVKEINQDDEIKDIYEPESALCQVLKMTNIDLDMDIVYEVNKRGISEIHLPMHKEKYSLPNGLILTLERKICDEVQFPRHKYKELLKDINQEPSNNIEYPIYKTYRSAFIEDKNGKRVKLFPNEEDKKRRITSFIVGIDGDKLAKLGIEDNYGWEIISSSEISTKYAQEHILTEEKQVMVTMAYEKLATYITSETVDGQVVQKKTLNDKQIAELTTKVKNKEKNISEKLEEARKKMKDKKLSGVAIADKIAREMIRGNEKRTITPKVGKELSNQYKQEYALNKKQIDR